MYKNFEIQFRMKLLEDKKLKDNIKKNASKCQFHMFLIHIKSNLNCLSFFMSLFFTVNNNPEDLKSFHEVLAPVIAIGNIFSIFPVAGIFSKNVESLKFRIWHPITIYSIIVNFCLLVEFCTLFLFLYKAPFQFFMVGEYFLLPFLCWLMETFLRIFLLFYGSFL